MLKQTKKHTVYEVWNEWSAESVFVDHKPAKAEVDELVKLNGWYCRNLGNMTLDGFVKKYIHVERLGRFYITNKK